VVRFQPAPSIDALSVSFFEPVRGPIFARPASDPGPPVLLNLQIGDAMLFEILSRYWWLTLLRGVTWVLFGIMVFAQPGITLVTLTILFGLFTLADGIGHVVSALGGRHETDNWWVLLLAGLCGIVVGVLTFLAPGITALVLLFYIAAWAISTGLLQLVTAIRLRKEIEGEFWLALSGLVSIVFGLFLMVRPGEGALSVLWIIGAYAIVFGLLLIALALRTRGLVKSVVKG
jgi:uncharacterized membrane protein HdeD (DUF308 family)